MWHDGSAPAWTETRPLPPAAELHLAQHKTWKQRRAQAAGSGARAEQTGCLLSYFSRPRQLSAILEAASSDLSRRLPH